MSSKYRNLMFTPAVQEMQVRYGTRTGAARGEARDLEDQRLGPDESEFVAARDGFYLASVGEQGWPYVQFRGGPPGFLKVIDEATLAYADLRGNGQYISTGNVSRDDRVALFFMDYANRRRLKLMATMRAVDATEDPQLLARVLEGEVRGVAERVVTFHVVAFDWNCPQHITPRFTAEEWRAIEARST